MDSEHWTKAALRQQAQQYGYASWMGIQCQCGVKANVRINQEWCCVRCGMRGMVNPTIPARLITRPDDGPTARQIQRAEELVRVHLDWPQIPACMVEWLDKQGIHIIRGLQDHVAFGLSVWLHPAPSRIDYRLSVRAHETGWTGKRTGRRQRVYLPQLDDVRAWLLHQLD